MNFPLLPPLFSFFFFFLFTTPLHSTSTPPLESHFIKSIPPSLRQNPSQQYFELTHPLPTDHLTPSCTRRLLRHHFGDTIGKPPVSVPYSPPPSSCAWSHAVLDFRASCKGEQYDRIAAVWIDGAELLRTSTAEPTDDGIFWNVRKDVTRYSSLLLRRNLTLTVMLENVVNDVFTGVYHVNVSLLFYKDAGVRVPVPGSPSRIQLNRKLGFDSDEISKNAIDSVYDQIRQKQLTNIYEKPADLIIPVSGTREEGFWFRIQTESVIHSKEIQIPSNTWKAVIEVYVSFHGDDEFWYSNPPDSYIQTNNLTTRRGNGAFREVFVTVDGKLVGSAVPFPVIFTGGINPLFWEPVVAVGAFDVPSYDFDLTPFLGSLLDEKPHFFGLGVVDSIPFWLVDANLHLWLDHKSSEIQAKAVDYHAPSLKIERKSVIKQLDGSFKTEATRKCRFIGWVHSTAGNLTSHISQEFKFKNLIKFSKNGTDKIVNQRVKSKTETKVESENGTLISRIIVRRIYPLTINTATLPGSGNDTYLMINNVFHSFKEKLSGNVSRSVYNKQDSNGWMVVKDHSVLSGAGATNQVYDYRDRLGCYRRMIGASNGRLLEDNTSFACTSSF